VTNIDIIGSTFTSNKPYLFRAIFEWILDNEGTPHLLIDATEADVNVPQQHVKDGQIVLNVAPSAVQNWLADNKAISFSARFSGKAQNIYVPLKALKALYAQENGMGMVFPEEVIGQSTDEDIEQLDHSDSQLVGSEEKPKSNKVAHLKVIK